MSPPYEVNRAIFVHTLSEIGTSRHIVGRPSECSRQKWYKDKFGFGLKDVTRFIQIVALKPLFSAVCNGCDCLIKLFGPKLDYISMMV